MNDNNERIRFVRQTRDGLVKMVESRFNAVLASMGDQPYLPEGPDPTKLYVPTEPFALLWDGLTLTIPLDFETSAIEHRRNRLAWPLNLTERVLLVECYDLAPHTKPITGRSIETTVRHCLPLGERALRGDRWNISFNAPLERRSTTTIRPTRP